MAQATLSCPFGAIHLVSRPPTRYTVPPFVILSEAKRSRRISTAQTADRGDPSLTLGMTA